MIFIPLRTFRLDNLVGSTEVGPNRPQKVVGSGPKVRMEIDASVYDNENNVWPIQVHEMKKRGNAVNEQCIIISLVVLETAVSVTARDRNSAVLVLNHWSRLFSRPINN